VTTSDNLFAMVTKLRRHCCCCFNTISSYTQSKLVLFITVKMAIRYTSLL